MALIEGVDVEHRGSGPDLVILHSLLADRSAFDRVVPGLSKKRRVWLVNLPGYGASRPAGTSVENYADRIAALLRSLKLNHPDILGNGLGGFISVALAARHGALVRRLIAAPALAALDLSPVLSNIKSETLVMAGSEDATTPPALARELAAKIPQAKFRELQGCGHCPQIENPALFVQVVEEYLGAA